MEKKTYFERKILLVDDSSVVRHLLKNALNEKGYFYTDIASDGIEAREKIQSNPYDLVITDYNMPGMNGGELLGFIKSNYPAIIVVILSEQADKNVVVSLMREADNYVVKDDITRIKDEIVNVFTRAFRYSDMINENKQLLKALKQKTETLEEQLKMARHLQKEIFPREIIPSAIFEIHILNQSCQIMGGDYYNVVRLDDDHIGIFLGDICGHGIQAALLSFPLHNSFNAAQAAVPNHSARDTLKNMNRRLCKLFPLATFSTGVYIVLNERRGTVSYACASEMPLLYAGGENNIDVLKNGNIAYLGLVDNAMVQLDETTLDLAPGEKILCFTDGLVEVKNKSAKCFGLEGVKDFLMTHRDTPLEPLCNSLYKEIKNYSNNNIADDVTIIAIERK